MSDAKDRLTKKIAAQTGGTAAPTQKAGSAAATRNKFGDVLSATRKTNKYTPRLSLAGQGNPNASPRGGERYQEGVTKSGNVVHFYSDGTRVVLNKKSTPTFKRNI